MLGVIRTPLAHYILSDQHCSYCFSLDRGSFYRRVKVHSHYAYVGQKKNANKCLQIRRTLVVEQFSRYSIVVHRSKNIVSNLCLDLHEVTRTFPCILITTISTKIEGSEKRRFGRLVRTPQFHCFLYEVSVYSHCKAIDDARLLATRSTSTNHVKIRRGTTLHSIG